MFYGPCVAESDDWRVTKLTAYGILGVDCVASWMLGIAEDDIITSKVLGIAEDDIITSKVLETTSYRVTSSPAAMCEC